jgi:hypothetical protein
VEIVALRSRAVEQFGSAGVDMLRLLPVHATSGAASLHVAGIAPGGTLGRHPTRQWQLFAVAEGWGWVAGPDDVRQHIEAGRAAVWKPGEEHSAGRTPGCWWSSHSRTCRRSSVKPCEPRTGVLRFHERPVRLLPRVDHPCRDLHRSPPSAPGTSARSRSDDRRGPRPSRAGRHDHRRSGCSPRTDRRARDPTEPRATRHAARHRATSSSGIAVRSTSPPRSALRRSRAEADPGRCGRVISWRRRSSRSTRRQSSSTGGRPGSQVWTTAPSTVLRPSAAGTVSGTVNPASASRSRRSSSHATASGERRPRRATTLPSPRTSTTSLR